MRYSLLSAAHTLLSAPQNAHPSTASKLFAALQFLGHETNLEKNCFPPGTYHLQGTWEALPPNKTFCMVLPPNGIRNVEIYIGKQGFCPSKLLAQAGFAPLEMASSFVVIFHYFYLTLSRILVTRPLKFESRFHAPAYSRWKFSDFDGNRHHSLQVFIL